MQFAVPVRPELGSKQKQFCSADWFKSIGPAIVEITCLRIVKLAVPITTIALKAKGSYFRRI